MKDIYELLNLSAEKLQNFPLLANNIINKELIKRIDNNIAELGIIENNMLVDNGIRVSRKTIEDTIRKLKYLSTRNDFSKKNWNFSELRIISYNLTALHDSDKNYDFAIQLLNKNWKDIFSNGLLFYLLKYWNDIESKYRKKASNLLIDKIKSYNGTNAKFKKIQEHANFFEENGPLKMSALIKQKKIELIDAPEIIGYKKGDINYSYYSDVIIKYIEDNLIREIDYVEKIFEIHNDDRTRKLVIATLVEIEEIHNDEIHRSLLAKFINRTLGNITIASTWAPFQGSTDKEAERIKQTMQIVNKWFYKQLIEVFFDYVQDIRRKHFWLRYIDYMNDFKIVGSKSKKIELQSNEKIGEMIQNKFIETNSKKSQTLALVLYIKNKIMIEFSDVGAVYAYNSDHHVISMINSNKIASTDDLKMSYKYLIGDYPYNEEGKMDHRGYYWEDKLASWINQMVLQK